MGMFVGPKIVNDAETARARATAGAEYLDNKFGPGWQATIDLHRLDIGNFQCILGQLGAAGYFCFPGLISSEHYGFSSGLLHDIVAVIYRPFVARSYDLLTEAWVELIRERRRQIVEQFIASDQAVIPAEALSELKADEHRLLSQDSTEVTSNPLRA